MKKFVFAFLLVLASGSWAIADDAPPANLDSALKLIRVMKLERTVSQLPAIFAAQLSNGDQDMQGPLEKFFKKILDYKTMEPMYARLYAKYYTNAELDDLSHFYGSRTGKKTLEMMPKIMTESMQIGQAQVRAHQDELKQLVQDIVAKKKSQGGNSTQ